MSHDCHQDIVNQADVVIAQTKHHDLRSQVSRIAALVWGQLCVDSTTGHGKTDDLEGGQHVELYRTVELAARQGDTVRRCANEGRDTRLEVRVRGNIVHG